ncbi:MAG TPA: hypothetical protein VGK77_28340, partial [Candidatus Binatia bacterium]
MADVSAGEITGRLRIDLTDLDRLRTEAAKTGQTVRSELGQRAQVSIIPPETLSNLRTATTEAQKLGTTTRQVVDAMRTAPREFFRGLADGARTAVAEFLNLKKAATESVDATRAAAQPAQQPGGTRTSLARPVGVAPAISLVANELGAVGPLGNVAAAAMLQLSTGITRTTVASAAAVVSLTGLGAVLRRTAEEKANYDAAIRTGNADFFIAEIERLQNTLKDLDSATSTYLGRVATRIQQWQRGETFFPAKLAEQVQDYSDRLQNIKTDKLSELTREFERQAKVSKEVTATGKIELQSQGNIETLVKQLEKLKASGTEIQGVIAALKGSVAANVQEVQRNFVTSLNDQNAALRSQIIELTNSKEAAIQHAAGLIEAKAATVGFTGNTQALNAALAEFKTRNLELVHTQVVEQFAKQARALEVQKTEMLAGREAAEKLALTYSLLDTHLGKLPPKVVAMAHAQLTLKNEIRDLGLVLEQTYGVFDRIDAEQGETFKNLQQNVKDAGSAVIEMNERIASARTLAPVLGPGFNLQEVEQSARRTALETLARNPAPEAATKFQEVSGTFQAAKAAPIVADLARAMEQSAREAQVLGGAVDLPSEAINNLTTAIKKLIAEGLNPLGPEIQQLKQQLEDARGVQRFGEALQGIGTAALDAINEISNGGKLKDVARNLAARINQELTRALITKPLEEWIKAQVNTFSLGGLFGAGRTVPPLPTGFGTRPAGVEGPSLPGGFFSTQAGAAAAKTGTDQAAIAAIQAQSATATTAIEASATAGQTAITTTGTTAQTAITTTGTTAQAGIEAVKVAALAAIEAARTGASIPVAGGGGIPLVGGLFDGGGAEGTLSLAQASLGFDPYAGLSAGLAAFARTGGAVRESGAGLAHAPVNPAVFSTAPRFEKGGAVTAVQTIAHLMNAASISRAPHYQQGGITADEVPIIAHKGEYVLPKPIVDRIGITALEGIRASGKLPEERVGSNAAQWIGEKGRPEIFTPKTSGHVIPIDRFAGAEAARIPDTRPPMMDYDVLLPGRAFGGDVSANRSYWVGERGLPELFV